MYTVHRYLEDSWAKYSSGTSRRKSWIKNIRSSSYVRNIEGIEGNNVSRTCQVIRNIWPWKTDLIVTGTSLR